MIRPSVAVVLLNWNGLADTLDCIESLQRLERCNFHIVVVDNGSQDDSVALITAKHPQIKMICASRNLGFSRGNNLGIRWALEHDFDFVWLLNNDTTVDPKALMALIEAFDERVGIVGSVLYEAQEPKRVQAWGGGRLNVWLGTTTQNFRPDQPVEHIIGTSMLVPAKVLREVGLLEEAFFFYMEDTEFSWRVRQRGYRLKVAADSAVFHKGGASVNRGFSGRSMRSELHFAHGNGVFMGLHGGLHSLLTVPLRLLGVAMQRLRRGQLGRVLPIFRAFFEGFGLGLSRRRAA